MKLHLTATSERGKPITKSGNDYLELEVKGENKQNILELNITDTGEYYVLTGYAISAGQTPSRRSEQYLRYEIAKPKTARENYNNCPWNTCTKDVHCGTHK